MLASPTAMLPSISESRWTSERVWVTAANVTEAKAANAIVRPMFGVEKFRRDFAGLLNLRRLDPETRRPAFLLHNCRERRVIRWNIIASDEEI